MKKFISNYKQTLILLASIILGGLIGLIFKEKALVLKPFGDIFINLMFIVIVPLIFLTISSAIIKVDDTKRLGKIISRIFLVFILMSVVSVFIGIISTRGITLVKSGDAPAVKELLDYSKEAEADVSILEKTASLLTVDDFNKLLSKDNIIAILVFAMLFGFAVRISGEAGNKVKEIVISLNDIVLNIIKLIMYYAPIGLGAYFAALISTYGAGIAAGFLKTFIVYTVVCLFVYFIVYTFYVYLAGGKEGVKVYWRNVIAPTVTAMATCSSAASIPVNVTSITKMGISSDIAEATVPLGTSFHKEGSVIGNVFKIMFLAHLFEMNLGLVQIVVVSLIATLLISAVPIGGGTIAEMMILTLIGFPVAALPILTIIATIIDAPATVLNVVGDTVASTLVARSVDGKNWVKPKKVK